MQGHLLIALWTIAFGCIFHASKAAWSYLLPKRKELTPTFSSYTTSFVHGCLATAASFWLVWNAKGGILNHFHGDNEPGHNAVLSMSTGYFLAVSDSLVANCFAMCYLSLVLAQPPRPAAGHRCLSAAVCQPRHHVHPAPHHHRSVFRR